MTPPGRTFRLSPVEYLTLLLLGAILFVVILPRCRAPAPPFTGTQQAHDGAKQSSAIP